MAGLEEHLAPLRAPLRVCLWVTQRCNLRCRYCYAAPLGERDVPLERFRSLCKELLGLRVFDFVISGGEPFLHPKIFEILQWFFDHDVHVGVLTNGTLLHGDLAQRLARFAEGHSLLLQVSLDSADPAVNDRSRGAGASVSSNIRELARLALPLQLSTVVNRANLSSAHRIIDTFYPDVKRFQFLMIQRTPATMSSPEILVSEAESRKFWRDLELHARKFPSDLVLPSLRTILRNEASRHPRATDACGELATFTCASCSAGTTHVDIDADFNVFGCDIARARTRMGNVLATSFQSVWNGVMAHAVRSATLPACHLT